MPHRKLLERQRDAHARAAATHDRAALLHDRAAEQAVSADDGISTLASRVIDDEEVVAVEVEPIAIPPASPRLGAGMRAHLLEEHAIAQRLGGIDLVLAQGESNLELAAASMRCFRLCAVADADPAFSAPGARNAAHNQPPPRGAPRRARRR